MMKAAAHLKDGRLLIVFGIGDGNVERMKRHDPIVAFGSDVLCEGLMFVIGCRTPEGSVGIPRVVLDRCAKSGDQILAIALTDAELERTGEQTQVVKTLEMPKMRIIIARGKDNESMNAEMRPLIGPMTEIRGELPGLGDN